MANDSDTCESLKEDLKSDQDELNALIRRAPFVTDPDERRLLAEEMSRLRQEIRELQHAISIACRPPPPPPNVSITGVEQTQATQFFKSLLSPCPDRPGQAPCVDNDIPLVAGKATVFRVYTNVLAHPTVPITALTGVLEARPAGSTGLPPSVSHLTMGPNLLASRARYPGRTSTTPSTFDYLPQCATDRSRPG